MTSFSTLILTLFLAFQSCCNANADITYDEITVQLKADLVYYLNKIGGDFTVGNLVRFGFHTCVTGCDGCLNLNNPPNAGLSPSFNALVALYNDTSLPSNIVWSSRVANLADFWTLCSTVGNLIAIPNGNFVPDFHYWVGRKACPTSPSQTLKAAFPDATKGLSAQSQFFGEVFALTQPQYIALIGGHTLGFAHSYASGFDTLPWTTSPTILNNVFYSTIIADPWHQTQAAANGLYEWEVGSTFMFNSDICIYRNLLNLTASNGKASCKLVDNTCPVRTETEQQIELYAKDQNRWLVDYAEAWNIMMLAPDVVGNRKSLTRILPK